MSSELETILAAEPAYRRKQIERAWFDININGYLEICTLPATLREKLKNIPWLSLEQKTLLKSAQDNTRKSLFKLNDGNCVETVIMGRESQKEKANNVVAGRRYTICVSSQAGCPMGCVFCATGRRGFIRNLTAEEIIDQVRFCQRLLAQENARIANIVVMGQGEPLLNYDNLKRALQIIVANTDIGPTKITVSTAGIPKMMEKLLEDKDFPQVRWAISLHSAIDETRKKIMPFHQKGFFNFLIEWVKKYHAKISSRSHFIGLEYIMFDGFNDDEKHLQALIKLAKKIPRLRINLIPFNSTEGNLLRCSAPENIDYWHETLMKAGFTATIRYSQGQDIAAACGQLQGRIA